MTLRSGKNSFLSPAVLIRVWSKKRQVHSECMAYAKHLPGAKNIVYSFSQTLLRRSGLL